MTDPRISRSRRVVHAALAVVALSLGAAGCRCNRAAEPEQPSSQRGRLVVPASQPASQPTSLPASGGAK